MQTHPKPTFQKYITKPQTVKFSSLIPILNFAGTNYTTHICQSILNHYTKNTPQILRPQNFHLTHPSFELCRSNSHICFEFCLNNSPYYTPYICQPILNQQSKEKPQNLRPQDFHLTHPSFELYRSSSTYYTTYINQPVLNQCPPRQTTNFRSNFFHLIHLFWTLPEQFPMLYHICEPTHPVPRSQDLPQTTHDPIWAVTQPLWQNGWGENFRHCALNLIDNKYFYNSLYYLFSK